MKPIARRRAELLLGLMLFYAILWTLWLTPAVFPLRIFVVLLHEISHALAALATGGVVQRIELFSNEGGATWVAGGNAFVMLSAGYLGSLLWGLLLIEAAGLRAGAARRVLLGLGAFTGLIGLVFVRNAFGLLFTLLFAAALVFAARRLAGRGVALVLLMLGLTSTLYALLDIRSDVFAGRGLESDAVMLARLTGVPALVWGGLWIGVALAACALALRRWLRRA